MINNYYVQSIYSMLNYLFYYNSFQLFYVLIQEPRLQFIDCLSAMEPKKLNSNQNTLRPYSEKSKLYMTQLKHFLETYKTTACSNELQHNHTFCTGYHSLQQKRRNPYLQYTFAYGSQNNCTCSNHQTQFCKNPKNIFQKIYHPLNYKTQYCSNQYNCELGMFCPYLHAAQKQYFQYGEFFRFDIQLFKTQPCTRREHHQRTTCNYYHNQIDRRRPYFDQYSHLICGNSKKCPKQQTCQFSHNRIQQLYHPSRFKSKFCKALDQCQYRQFCSFAHSNQEIRVRILDDETEDTYFYMYLYKTIWCPHPYTKNHDRSECIYAHNYQDFRRNPKQKKYKPEKCPYWDFKSKDIKSIEQAGCKNKLDCDKCHGWMELRCHPENYNPKNNPCKKEEEIISSKKFIQQKKNSIIKALPPIPQKKISVGAPFFKQQRQASETSRQTKAKTGNISSENQDGMSVKDDNKSENMQPKYVNFCQDQPIWQNQRGTALIEAESTQRAKSLGKQQSQVNYSKSIKNMFQTTSILSKLKKKRFNEVKIINLTEEQIKQFKFLSQNEKETLSRKVTQYSLKRQIRFIQYSPELTRFFVRRKCQKILQKMRLKKVKEEKLLNLMSKQIKQLSFLDSCEKGELPHILKEFANDKEFAQINQLIKDNVQMS